jgi:hypothetical protein
MELSAPQLFPAELDEFVCLVVRAKTLNDGTKRFRDFLRHRVWQFYYEPYPKPTRASGETPNEFKVRLGDCHRKEQRRLRDLSEIGKAEINERIEATVVKQMTRYGGDGIGERHWQSLATDYSNWWRSQRSEKARESGKAGAKKAAKSKKSIDTKKLRR